MIQYGEELVMKILIKILAEKNSSTGYSNWKDILTHGTGRNYEELIQDLEKENLIVQRYGRFNEVKLKNGLLEQIIKDIPQKNLNQNSS